MRRSVRFKSLAAILQFSVAAMAATGCAPHVDLDATVTPPETAPSRTTTSTAKLAPDLSGRARFGKASFYARRFVGRDMADGVKMNPQGDNAASKTLPLGTTAKITNIENGQSAVVTIEDRGPYVRGRIVDLSPSTARKIGISERNGVAKVKVAPIAVMMPDGSTKDGTAAPDAKP